MAPKNTSPSRQIDKILDAKVRGADRGGRPLGRTTVAVRTPSGTATVVVDDADRLGVQASSVGLQQAGGSPSDVSRQAQEAVRRLTYLQEPLAVIETDAHRGRSILRSSTPRKTDGGPEYNEAVLDGGESITIKRFRAEPGARRRQVPSNLSRDTLRRIVDDLGDILQTK